MIADNTSTLQKIEIVHQDFNLGEVDQNSVMMKAEVFEEAKVLVLVEKNKSTLTALKFQNI